MGAETLEGGDMINGPPTEPEGLNPRYLPLDPHVPFSLITEEKKKKNTELEKKKFHRHTH